MSTSIASIDSSTSILQVNGVNALQLTPGGVANLNGAQLAGQRRRNHNGDCTVATTGTSFAGGTGNTTFWTIDGYVWEQNFDGAVTVSQQADVPSDIEFQSSLRMTVTTADTSIATTQYAMMNVYIEGYDVRDFINRPLTISFWVRSAKAGIHGVSIRSSGFDQSYIMSYTVNVANTWEKKSVTCTQGLNGTAGTWNWANGTGMRIHFVLSGGATFQTTPGSWIAGNLLAPTGQVNVCDTVNNIFAITGVQVEPGLVATPFEHRTYTSELAQAQRYCYSIFPQANQCAILNGAVWSVGAVYSAFQLPVTMRATPTIVLSAMGDFAIWGNGATQTVTSISVAVSSPWVAEVVVQFPGPFTAGTSAWLRTANVNARLSFLARLP